MSVSSRLVLLDDHRLEGTRAQYDAAHRGGIALEDRRRILLEVREEVGIEDDAVLDDFREAAAVFTLGERGERGQVDPDAERLMEGADHVLGPRMVDRRLAADGAVDHGQQRGRHHEQRQAAGEGRGHEAREVADDAAADRDDQCAPIGGQVDEGVVELRCGCERFVRFAGRTHNQ